MSLTTEQQQAAYAPSSVSVTAGAGTGKTHMLAERYLHHLKSGFSPLEIVAVTFTEKAAAELRSRIRQTVATQVPDQFDWLAELEAAQISTFHSLAARICREHPEAANVPSDFGLLDTLEGTLWQAEQLAIAIDQLPTEFYEQVPYSLMQAVMGTFLNDPLNAEAALQREQKDWLPVLEQLRQKAAHDLLNHPVWQEARYLLGSCAGQPGDRTENMRQTAVEAIAQAEQGDDLQAALLSIAGLNFVGGSARNWSSRELWEEVKASAKALRDLVREVLKAGLITLQVTELDTQVEAMLPTLRSAFEQVRSHLREAKRQRRILDFNDLEVHALEALSHKSVRNYYAKRWRAFLIDEFQDTNPIQGKFLELLTQDAVLTLVGDEKQSIYGFRRADVQVFQDWRDRLHRSGGQIVALTQSFRTHTQLIQNINTVFSPVLGALHQDLHSERIPPHSAPHLQVYAVTPDGDPKPAIDQTRVIEAQHIADVIEKLLNDKVEIWDKPTRSHRPIQPGDIAVLARTWEPLGLYGQTIEHRGIPIVQAGGGNLLETREAKDAFALLQFLADPRDDLSLVAVLRSPFFAVSDRTLGTLSQLPDAKSWWQRLKQSDEPAIVQIFEVLTQILRERDAEPPTRLLQLADRLTGYTAVIANLSGGDRRMADWRGFLEVVRQLEQGMADVLVVVRRLKRLVRHEVSVPRPALAAGNAVSLMTIHAAKGLEWSVVIVPDLTRQRAIDSPKVRFDPDLGVSLKLEDEAGDKHKSALYILLEQQQKQREQAEAKRLLYVALTRARDRLILTAAEPSGNGLSLLRPGLEGHYPIQPIPFDPTRVAPLPPILPQLPTRPTRSLLSPIRSNGMELPVTALTIYARCPKQFRLKFIDGHPGFQTGTSNHGAEIGLLTHIALERKITALEELKPFNPTLPSECVQDALKLAEQFWRSPTFASVRQGTWECTLQLKQDSLILNGSADLLGDTFVLDIKTDQEMHPQEHRFQLWAYAAATQKTTAHIAYLRHDTLHTFNASDLQSIDQEAEELMGAIAQGHYGPNPSPKSCAYCAYSEICEDAILPTNMK
ncbi:MULTISPECIES: UvrD-helicase domain-containing protein [unclassified Leptolyngbya]|uniref:UvrD-helicase domain-containing protein n=1 Tax=unclassified Leptolyngbya TaxID=2650499 RepID=UPI00168233CB|nr:MULTISPECIES: UvrD-helicase domain-containing protein [unclassified Leptolyngbya]MBD1909933.1 UvrD-helicase domain-containing protein [Leptolyngbya sp. FACHB-8]MBD2158603.1 UvrD-helicase domain-containing protein [Leptolyngbya sp. FACHB-16]